MGQVSPDEIQSFLNRLTDGNKPYTQRIRFSQLSCFFNFVRNNIDSGSVNPCDTPMIRKRYRQKGTSRWEIIEIGTIDGIIFRTTKNRNRLLLERMAGKTHKLTIPRKMPVKQFRALTVYDRAAKRFIYAPSERTTISSSDLDTQKKNADGPVTLYLSPGAPKGLESKWIPSAEGKGVVARQSLAETGGKSRTRRTEIGYAADDRRLIWQWTEAPDSHSDATQINPAGTFKLIQESA